MLHGVIEVNAQPIGSWRARNICKYESNRHTYDCEVTMLSDPEPICFEVKHNREDGALWLATIVLTRAANIASERPRQ